jgi:hypothetical protein
VRLPSPGRVALACAALGLAYRAALTTVYYGQEEGDYGNLGLILGTVQSGFRYVETEHMPLYTWLSAAVCLVTGDAHSAGLVVSLVMGGALVGLVSLCAGRWLSPEAGLLAGALLIVQPDLALTSATTLRYSTYGACAAATMLAAGSGRWVWAGILFGAAFLTRFDAMVSLAPALALAAVWPALQGHRAPAARRALGLALAGSVIVAWAGAYRALQGTWRFWEGVAARNMSNYEGLAPGARLGKGMETLALVCGRVLPDHLGWSVLACGALGFAFLARGTARSPGPARLLATAALGGAGLFVGLVLLSAYRWDHNLYWSWLSVAAPLLLAVSAHGACELVRALAKREALARALALGLGLSAALPMYRQTWQQVLRSRAWIGAQVTWADWADEAAPPGAVLLADLVPATWLGRRPDAREVMRWSQLGADPPPDDPEAFAAWVRARDVRVVFWFREGWIGAADRAPFLADGAVHTAGGLTFTPVAREDGYGVFVYRVDGSGLPPLDPPAPPAAPDPAPGLSRGASDR